jgi:hypothetical protein
MGASPADRGEEEATEGGLGLQHLAFSLSASLRAQEYVLAPGALTAGRRAHTTPRRMAPLGADVDPSRWYAAVPSRGPQPVHDAAGQAPRADAAPEPGSEPPCDPKPKDADEDAKADPRQA